MCSRGVPAGIPLGYLCLLGSAQTFRSGLLSHRFPRRPSLAADAAGLCPDLPRLALHHFQGFLDEGFDGAVGGFLEDLVECLLDGGLGKAQHRQGAQGFFADRRSG